MSIILAPDVFVNASVALGSAPEHVVRRHLVPGGKAPSSAWIMARVDQMLRAVPSFKEDAIGPHMDTIRSLVDAPEVGDFGADAWKDALVAAAKHHGAERVVTDHPDLTDGDEQDGVFFCSTDAYLVELTTPPPPPGG